MSTSIFTRLCPTLSKKAIGVWLISTFMVSMALPAAAASKSKDAETLRNAANVLQTMLSDQNIPSDLIAKAECIMVLPNVKKFAFGIGGSGGRGPLVCRTSTGKWSAPAMYTVGGMSAGLQIGGSSSDFVLLVMSEKGVNAILNGKTELGSDATAAAGPTGASAQAVGAGNDILTYKRAQGMFAGVSLGGASLQPDNDANQRLYGQSMTPQEIVHPVTGNVVRTPSSAQALVSLLDSRYAKN
jgi:SH3 domain-containing YSC84-like protein 1